MKYRENPIRGLDGKVAIVTGGGGGIGQCICLRLADEGVQVAVFDIEADDAQQAQHK
jgi:2-hydroxycyclohexanecarboxyl-CoA dehydrogenase